MKTCYLCGMELKSLDDPDDPTKSVKQYVTSSFTKRSYCMPGVGCWVNESIIEPSEEPESECLENTVSGNNNLKDLSAENMEATSVPVPAT